MKTRFTSLKTILAVFSGLFVAASLQAETFNYLTVTYNIAAQYGNISSHQGFTSPYGYVNTSTASFSNYATIGGYLNVGATFKVGNSSQITSGVVNGVALGAAATSPSFSALAIGRHNVLTASDGSPVSKNSWVGKDPLFIVGNGTDATARNNAFTVYKDGTITMSKVQGDILMGEFGN